ncbi:hypothetical protein ABZ865_39610 [Streptomyces sp. NPDC047085]|uniref:hypothetical protein n=1 Tax=Streptomyces sp. NPDC047085 TaxID=3155140 RepID=UPI0033FCEFF2
MVHELLSEPFGIQGAHGGVDGIAVGEVDIPRGEGSRDLLGRAPRLLVVEGRVEGGRMRLDRGDDGSDPRRGDAAFGEREGHPSLQDSGQESAVYLIEYRLAGQPVPQEDGDLAGAPAHRPAAEVVLRVVQEQLGQRPGGAGFLRRRGAHLCERIQHTGPLALRKRLVLGPVGQVVPAARPGQCPQPDDVLIVGPRPGHVRQPQRRSKIREHLGRVLLDQRHRHLALAPRPLPSVGRVWLKQRQLVHQRAADFADVRHQRVRDRAVVVDEQHPLAVPHVHRAPGPHRAVRAGRVPRRHRL